MKFNAHITELFMRRLYLGKNYGYQYVSRYRLQTTLRNAVRHYEPGLETVQIINFYIQLHLHEFPLNNTK